MKTLVDSTTLLEFRDSLIKEEKSNATVRKYIHDVRTFLDFAKGSDITKNLVISYKLELIKSYEVTSANSMLSALNEYFEFLEMEEFKVKKFRVQRDAFCAPERELTRGEYMRLIGEAQRLGNERLSLIIQTICATGIRVSELSYVTVEAIERGEAVVDCKNKLRRIFIIPRLSEILSEYARKRGIISGPVFLTRTGKPITRTGVWRQMKRIAKKTSIDARKVFPHNLRHLFALTFYENDKDIAKLADILGHTSINTTRNYIISSGKEHKKQMEKMNLVT